MHFRMEKRRWRGKGKGFEHYLQRKRAYFVKKIFIGELLQNTIDNYW